MCAAIVILSLFTMLRVTTKRPFKRNFFFHDKLHESLLWEAERIYNTFQCLSIFPFADISSMWLPFRYQTFWAWFSDVMKQFCISSLSGNMGDNNRLLCAFRVILTNFRFIFWRYIYMEILQLTTALFIEFLDIFSVPLWHTSLITKQICQRLFRNKNPTRIW